jgi:SNF2 family DNA or RNA helicase
VPIRRKPLIAELSSLSRADGEPAPAPPAPRARRLFAARAASDSPGVRYLLSLRAQQLRLAAESEHLIAPQVLHDSVRPHGYQRHVVEQVLHEMAPGAILADEVGLGKTIEAGLVLKELMLRGVVVSALVVAPKALLSQWQEELRERFAEDFVLTEERRFGGFEHEDRVICSFQQFVRTFERISARPWDCFIVDEAHLLVNPDSKRRQCAQELRARWRLLLTATPLQNRITDLYSLIDLVAPGRLGTLRQFVGEYAADPQTCRTVIPTKVAELRAAAAEVMCRTRRSETDIALAPRTVDTYLVAASPLEAALVRDVTGYLRALYRRGIDGLERRYVNASRDRPRRRGSSDAAAGPRARVARPDRADARAASPVDSSKDASTDSALSRGALIREIIALQQSLSSSPQAIAAALRARADRHPEEQALLLDLATRCAGVRSAKEALLLDTLRRMHHQEAVLIFTLRLETARRLQEVIAAAGRSVACYTGRLTSEERRTLVNRFNRGDLQALVATDAGAEGLNLQERCHVVFNYDLHWNPMKMEQRIGRVHRLGQAHEVRVASFTLQDSIDEYVLRLLYQKIDLFTLTIGALESVLADLKEGELDFEERIVEALLTGDAPDAARADLGTLGDQMAAALHRQQEAESLTMGVLG